MVQWEFQMWQTQKTCLYMKKGCSHLMEAGSGDLETCDSTGVSVDNMWICPMLIHRPSSDATLRKSSHNVAMRDIVLKHIISLRAEYDEIPDSEFEPIRLEPAFDQAFGTWKVSSTCRRLGLVADIICRGNIKGNVQEAFVGICRLTRIRPRPSIMERLRRRGTEMKKGILNSLTYGPASQSCTGVFASVTS